MEQLEIETGELVEINLGERRIMVDGASKILVVLESGEIPPDEVVVNSDLFQISQASITRLCTGRWLNDECINAYIALINQRERETNPHQVKSFAVNTFFLPMLEDMRHTGTYNFNKLHRIIKKKKVSLRKVKNFLIPINIKHSHWLLLNCHISTSTFYLIDSLGSRDCEPYVDLISQFLEDYFKETMGDGPPVPEESLKRWRSTSPK